MPNRKAAVMARRLARPIPSGSPEQSGWRAACRQVAFLVVLCALIWGSVREIKAGETAFVVTPVGVPFTVFDPGTDACDGHDVADVPLRAWRGEDGQIHAFALHFENRRLSGKGLMTLKIECPVVFRGTGSSDPARYDDRIWIAATWTKNGRDIAALGHHEFQANEHPGRCSFKEYMKCWWNSVLALQSGDGGVTFRRAANPVAVATPFRSETGQGRHRGFFNPSNILERSGKFYMFASTTGWEAGPGREAQNAGVCLFRADDPASGRWLAFDGKAFSAAFPDPYAKQNPPGKPCKIIAPFPAPVGSITRHRSSGMILAVYQAAGGTADGFGRTYPVSGFYLSTSKDMLNWSEPVLLVETRSLYDNPCGADVLRSYPVLIDEAAEGRNFDNVGDVALLFYSEMRISGCNHTGDRKLIARKVRISTYIRE